MAGNPNFDAILSTTLKKYTPRIEDNIFKNLPLLYFLQEADHIDTVDGGESLVDPLMYGKNGTAGSYQGYDNIDTTPQEGITAANYAWRQFAASVAISGLEEIKNHGDAAVIRLLDAKVQQAEMSIEEAMENMFFLDGSGNSGKDWYGLAYFIPDSPSGATTIGGIDSSSSANSWWRATSTNVAGVLTIDAMSKLYNTVSKGKDHPDFALGTEPVYRAYEALLQPALRYSDSKTADAGFENLLYKSMPIMFSDYCQSGNLYYLNSRYLRLQRHSQVWFQNSPFVKPHGQDARYSLILSAGNLTSSNLQRLGKLYGLTDS